MSTSPELGDTPPSIEVQSEMAMTEVRSFKALNAEYRKLIALINRHPTSERLETLGRTSKLLAEGADPIIEAMFFKDISPALVNRSSKVVLDEISKNRKLEAAIEGDKDYEEPFDEEFRLKLVERILSDEPEEEDSPGLLVVTSDPLDMPPNRLAQFIGGLYYMSVEDLFTSLENSDSVNSGLEAEYARREHIKMAAIGAVAFVGAIAGSILANRLNRR